MARILLAATGSGVGKTTLVCGLLELLRRRAIPVSAMKCGPDFVDPLFHRTVQGVSCGNLDPFFCDANTLCSLLSPQEAAGKLVVIEGVMGYYDGIGLTDRASSYTVAAATDTPVILVVNGKGMGGSMAAMLEGFLRHRPDSHLRGVIFNRISPMLYPKMAALAKNLGLQPLGFLPDDPTIAVESRQLGLIPAGELPDWENQLARLADTLSETLDISGILALANDAPPLPRPVTAENDRRFPVRIAVAQDAGFCFLYPENLAMLTAMGAELCPFSPGNEPLPEKAAGLWLPGGYPDNIVKTLGGNAALRDQLREQIVAGLPTIAEGAGFCALHTALQCEDGQKVPVLGVLAGEAYVTSKLQPFGYVTLVAKEDSMLCQRGESFPSHAFHYWKSSVNGGSFTAEKAGQSRSWQTGYATETLYAGFCPLYLPAKPLLAERFLAAAVGFAQREGWQ